MLSPRQQVKGYRLREGKFPFVLTINSAENHDNFLLGGNETSLPEMLWMTGTVLRIFPELGRLLQ